MNILIAIPAYNAESTIGPLVREARALGGDVLVVDDGSTDRTAEVAGNDGAEVVRHPENLGKGAAIRTAIGHFGRTSRDLLVLMDADGQHDPAWIPALVDRATRMGAGLVVGDRMADASAMPWVRRATNRLMSWVVSRMVGSRIPDTQCGFRVLSRPFAMSFRPVSARYELESEMLIHAGRLGFVVESHPIRAIYSGQPSHIHPVRDTLRFLRFMVRFRRR